ncbi:MAG: alpha/beta hydrolase [Pseudomonadota bacterium]
MTAFSHILTRAALGLATAFGLAGIGHAQQDVDVLEMDAPPEIEVFQLDDPLSEVTSVVCPFKGSVDYEPGRVKCGFITVPENREVPDSRRIRLAFAQIVAEGRLEDEEEDDVSSDEDALVVRDDPVAYLTGGPGVGISSYVERFLDHELTETRDLYVLNQRGIGASDELCPFYGDTRREDVTSVTTLERELEDAERMKACFGAAAARGVDLRGYNTVENARDVRALRRALGLDSWNVWGISYGSHLGQMLVNVDPEGIRALVLDAIVPNDLGDLMRLHRWIDRDFRLIFDECERQDASVCDGLEDDTKRVFDALIETPLSVPSLDEELYPAETVSLPAALVAFAPFQMMYEQDAHPAIPAVMRALNDMLDDRDPDVMKAFAAGGMDDGLSDFSQAMGAAIRCNDGYAAAQAAVAGEDLAENPRFAGGVFTVEGSRAAAQACVDSGLAPRDRADYQLIESQIPTLIVNGDWDPITPPAMAERIAPGFANGRLIVVPYAGHGPTRSMSECGAQVMTDFFDDPAQDLSQLDASCLEEGVEPPEFLTFLQTDATLRMAGMAVEDEKTLILPGLLIGAIVTTLVISLIAIVIGVVARFFAPLPSNVASAGPTLPRALAAAGALVSLVGLGLIAAGGAAAYDMSELSLLAGFAPPARFGAWIVLLGGILGLAAIVTAFRVRDTGRMRLRTRIGLPLTGLASALLAVTLVWWGVTPW